MTGTERGLKLVAIGGGTGLSTVLAGLKRLVDKREDGDGHWLDALAAIFPSDRPRGQVRPFRVVN